MKRKQSSSFRSDENLNCHLYVEWWQQTTDSIWKWNWYYCWIVLFARNSIKISIEMSHGKWGDTMSRRERNMKIGNQQLTDDVQHLHHGIWTVENQMTFAFYFRRFRSFFLSSVLCHGDFMITFRERLVLLMQDSTFFSAFLTCAIWVPSRKQKRKRRSVDVVASFRYLYSPLHNNYVVSNMPMSSANRCPYIVTHTHTHTVNHKP